jgi:hypothetical protein
MRFPWERRFGVWVLLVAVSVLTMGPFHAPSVRDAVVDVGDAGPVSRAAARALAEGVIWVAKLPPECAEQARATNGACRFRVNDAYAGVVGHGLTKVALEAWPGGPPWVARSLERGPGGWHPKRTWHADVSGPVCED